MRTWLPLLFVLALGAVACEDDSDPPFIPCTDDADCDTGYACVEYPESSVGACAETCEDGCRDGYACGGEGGLECVAVPAGS